MQSFFDMALLDSTLVQAAVRALALALVVGAGLTLLRVRNPHHQLTAWTAVLAGALAMPVLMAWMVVSVPVEEIVLPAGKIAEPLVAMASTNVAEAASLVGASTEPRIDGALESGSSIDWSSVLLIVYAAVAGLLLLRLAVGLVLTARIRAASESVYALWTGDADIRMSQQVAAPVTVGSTILLPADYETWSDEKRQAVLLHERAHVARGDFYVQIIAAVHRAVFWFSPLAWWLHDRLAELAEDASDAEAAAEVRYRADYAAVLLDFAQMPAMPRLKFAPMAVAMARPATVRRRIERVLEKKLPEAIGRGARAATAIIVIVAACAAAVSIVRTPANAAAGINEAPLPPMPPVAAQPARPAQPAPAAVPAAAPVAPVAPVLPIPPVEFGTHGLDVLGPPSMSGYLPCVSTSPTSRSPELTPEQRPASMPARRSSMPRCRPCAKPSRRRRPPAARFQSGSPSVSKPPRSGHRRRWSAPRNVRLNVQLSALSVPHVPNWLPASR